MNGHRHESKTHSSNWIVHLIWASLFLGFGILSFVYYKYTVDKAADASNRVIEEMKGAVSAATFKAEKAAGALADYTERIAARFHQGTINKTFKAEIPVFRAAGMGRLEVATAEVSETFTTEDTKSILLAISLGKTISEIKIPATYRYYVDMEDEWTFTVEGSRCIVHAPALKPFLPVAFDTERMEKKSQRGWARFNEIESMEDLERTISPVLKEHALAHRNIENARNSARETIANFIQAWLIREEQWRLGKFHSISVTFADELKKSDETSNAPMRAMY